MNLLRPELIRLTTRRLTWISALIGTLLVITLNLLLWSSELERAARLGTTYYHHLRPFDFADNAIPMGAIAALVAAAVAYIAGASYQGSESSSGALGTWLTFVPERGKVYAAKLAALTIAALAYGTLLVGGGIFSIWLCALAVGGDLDPKQVPMFAINGILATVAAALLGSALGTIMRSTLGALGTVIGLGVVANLVSLLPAALDLHLPPMVSLQLTFLGLGSRNALDDVAAGGLVTVLPVVLLVGVAAVLFRRRDVD